MELCVLKWEPGLCSRRERQARHRQEFEKRLQVGMFIAYWGDTKVTSLVEVDGSHWGAVIDMARNVKNS